MTKTLLPIFAAGVASIGASTVAIMAEGEDTPATTVTEIGDNQSEFTQTQTTVVANDNAPVTDSLIDEVNNSNSDSVTIVTVDGPNNTPLNESEVKEIVNTDNYTVVSDNTQTTTITETTITKETIEHTETKEDINVQEGKEAWDIVETAKQQDEGVIFDAEGRPLNHTVYDEDSKTTTTFEFQYTDTNNLSTSEIKDLLGDEAVVKNNSVSKTTVKVTKTVESELKNELNSEELQKLKTDTIMDLFVDNSEINSTMITYDEDKWSIVLKKPNSTKTYLGTVTQDLLFEKYDEIQNENHGYEGNVKVFTIATKLKELEVITDIVTFDSTEDFIDNNGFCSWSVGEEYNGYTVKEISQDKTKAILTKDNSERIYTFVYTNKDNINLTNWSYVETNYIKFSNKTKKQIYDYLIESGYTDIDQDKLKAKKDGKTYDIIVEGENETVINYKAEELTAGYVQVIMNNSDTQTIVEAKEKAINALAEQITNYILSLKDGESIQIGENVYYRNNFPNMKEEIYPIMKQYIEDNNEIWIQEGTCINFDAMVQEELIDMLKDIEREAMTSEYDYLSFKEQFGLNALPSNNNKSYIITIDGETYAVTKDGNKYFYINNNNEKIFVDSKAVNIIVPNYAPIVDHLDLGISGKLTIDDKDTNCMIIPDDSNLGIKIYWSDNAEDLVYGNIDNVQMATRNKTNIVQDDYTYMYEFEVHNGAPKKSSFYKVVATVAYDGITDEKGNLIDFGTKKAAEAYLKTHSVPEGAQVNIIEAAGNKTVGGTRVWIFTKTADLIAYGYMTQTSNTCANKYSPSGYDLTLGDLYMVGDKIMSTGYGTYSWTINMTKNSIDSIDNNYIITNLKTASQDSGTVTTGSYTTTSEKINNNKVTKIGEKDYFTYTDIHKDEYIGVKYEGSLTYSTFDYKYKVSTKETVNKNVDIIVKIPVTTPIENNPIKDNPIKDTPVKDNPVVTTPVKDIPIVTVPIKDNPIKDIPVVTTPVKDTAINTTPIENIPISQVSYSEMIAPDPYIVNIGGAPVYYYYNNNNNNNNDNTRTIKEIKTAQGRKKKKGKVVEKVNTDRETGIFAMCGLMVSSIIGFWSLYINKKEEES